MVLETVRSQIKLSVPPHSVIAQDATTRLIHQVLGGKARQVRADVLNQPEIREIPQDQGKVTPEDLACGLIEDIGGLRHRSQDQGTHPAQDSTVVDADGQARTGRQGGTAAREKGSRIVEVTAGFYLALVENAGRRPEIQGHVGTGLHGGLLLHQ